MPVSASPDLTSADVEAELREWVREFGGEPPGELIFWPGSAAVDCGGVEALDQVGECQLVALEAARRFGLGVCAGVVASDAHPERPVIHFWNRRLDGALVDAARSRRTCRGYLGAEFTPAEVAAMIDAIELEERWTEGGRKVGRVLSGLLG